VLAPGDRGGVEGTDDSGVPTDDEGRLEGGVVKASPKGCCESSRGREILSRMEEGG